MVWRNDTDWRPITWILLSHLWQSECIGGAVLAKSIVRLALLSASAGVGQSSGFLLGVDYSEWFDPNTRQIATDASGSLYVLSDCASDASGNSISCVTKLSADGKTRLWQNESGFWVSAMAVDSMGGVYVVPFVRNQQTGQPVEVVKLQGQSGSGNLWTASAGFNAYGSSLAVDSTGHAWVSGPDATGGYGHVIRFSADGSSIELSIQTQDPLYTNPEFLTVDNNGSAFFLLGSHIEKVTSDGALSVFGTVDGNVSALFVDAKDNVTVFQPPGPDKLLRFSGSGALVSTQTFADNGAGTTGELTLLTVDAAGNAYIGGYNHGYVHGVKNSLSTCGSNWLKVVAPDGSILQDTYIPGAENSLRDGYFKLMAPVPGGTFFLVAVADLGSAVTQHGPYDTEAASYLLLRLSQNSGAQTFPLVCQGNAATYKIAAVAPGEILALFGSGLGPEQGVPTTATSDAPYPMQAAGVQVTFDGEPAPLLWVQDSQINVIAPWSLTPGHATEICVNNNGTKTNCQTWPVWPAGPGVFTIDGVFAVALNQDGTLNSAQNPAQIGSTVTIFATGLGEVTPPPIDGSLIGSSVPLGVLPVSIAGDFPGVPALSWPTTVTYAGPVQGQVAGLSEVRLTAIAESTNFVLCAGGFCTNFAIH